MLRRIHTNSAKLFHGRSPLSEICNDLILAHRCRRGPSTPTLQEDLKRHVASKGNLQSPAELIEWCGRVEPMPGKLSPRNGIDSKTIAAAIKRHDLKKIAGLNVEK
jgi:hypothetical protein